MNAARTEVAQVIADHLATGDRLDALLPIALAERAAELSPAARTLVLDSDHPGEFYVTSLLDADGTNVLPADFDHLTDELSTLAFSLRVAPYDNDTRDWRLPLPALAGAK
ncbi:hypothetical protein [Prescottella equi]|uniref:hypothetical protein n=1 Tax=Rhodococcus hoagii TaxID=43767 RepID=UPI000D1085A1|nr:hypothetical protein [Prescottella equi]AVP71295.1 hypothetical protein C7H75_24750 [Prescottella equi]